MRQQARREGRSLNQVVLGALVRGAGLDGERVHDDLDHLIGTWQDDPQTEAALAEQDRVEPDLWR